MGISANWPNQAQPLPEFRLLCRILAVCHHAKVLALETLEPALPLPCRIVSDLTARRKERFNPGAFNSDYNADVSPATLTIREIRFKAARIPDASPPSGRPGRDESFQA